MTHACANCAVICNKVSLTLHTFLQDEQLGMQVDVHAINTVLVLHADLLLGVQATKYSVGLTQLFLSKLSCTIHALWAKCCMQQPRLGVATRNTVYP